MFNALRYLIDYNHKYKRSGPEVSKGWLGIPCPFCGDTSGHTHGAFNLKYGNYNCWRCGKHKLYKVIAELESCSYSKAVDIIKKYSIDEEYKEEKIVYAKSLDIRKVSKAKKMQKHHREYLQKRNFDDKKLEKEYNLLGTNILGDYPHRIIIPIIYQHQEVSFSGRTILGREPRYKFCSSKNEVVHYKDILYNFDRVKKNIVLVEGKTDVWRIGSGAVASFGSEVTKKQSLLLLHYGKNYGKIIFVCFDPEKSAQKRARELCANLKSIYEKVINIVLSETEDPGTMTESDVKLFRKEFGL